MKGVRLLAFLPAVLWMVFIFALSAMPEEVSEEQSREVALSLRQLAVRYLGEEREEAWHETAPSLSIRKLAHMMEYAILFLLLYGGILRNNENSPKAAALGAVLSVLYACSDEAHQLFVPGRSGEIRDIMIDLLGVAAGSVPVCISMIRGRKPREQTGCRS